MTNKDKKVTGRPPVHGASSSTVRQRFDDKRTGQGKALFEAMNSLVAHFGGPENVSSPMQILMDAAIRPKLIVLMIIGEWVNKQDKLISKDGTLPNVLGANYIAYTNALRRDLESLCNMAKDVGNKVKPLSIAELIK